MATVGNFIPEASKISNRYINAEPNYTLKMQKFIAEPKLRAEDTRMARIRQGIEGYKSKRYLAILMQTVQNLTSALTKLAEQKGLDLNAFIPQMNQRELLIARNLLNQVGVPASRINDDQLKALISRGISLPSKLQSDPSMTFSSASKFVTSGESSEESMQKAIQDSLEEYSKSIESKGFFNPPAGLNISGFRNYFNKSHKDDWFEIVQSLAPHARSDLFGDPNAKIPPALVVELGNVISSRGLGPVAVKGAVLDFFQHNNLMNQNPHYRNAMKALAYNTLQTWIGEKPKFWRNVPREPLVPSISTLGFRPSSPPPQPAKKSKK